MGRNDLSPDGHPGHCALAGHPAYGPKPFHVVATAGDVLYPLLGPLKIAHLGGVPPDQEKAVEVSAVLGQQHGLEGLDLARLLEPSQIAQKALKVLGYQVRTPCQWPGTLARR